jgi:hypothetical protein
MRYILKVNKTYPDILMPKPKSFPNKVLIGFSDDHLKALDQWRRKQEDMPTRSEAIRRLVEIGLAGAKKFAAPSQQTRAKAKKFAAEQIDRMGNSTATAEEQASRKQRLLKGPEEFREARVDRPKAKGK